MQTTQHFKDNWQKSNQWLRQNAPDYVQECVEELGHHLICTSKTLKTTFDNFNVLDTVHKEHNDLLNKRIAQLEKELRHERRVKWYHWFLPPVVIWRRIMWWVHYGN